MNARDALRMIGVAVDGLDVIQGITGIGGLPADKALAAIGKVVATLREGMNGKASAQAVSAEIDALFQSLAGNDERADADLKEKFGV